MDLIDTSKSAAPGCSDCSTCAAANAEALGRPESDGPERRQLPLAGSRFVVASIGYFLGPLVLAVAGASFAGQSGGRQLFGAVAGLATGMMVSGLAARLLVPSGKEIG